MLGFFVFSGMVFALPSATLTSTQYTNSATPNFTITYSDANGFELSCNTFTNAFTALTASPFAYSSFNITSSAGCNSSQESKLIHLRVESIDGNRFDTNTTLIYDNNAPLISANSPSGWQSANFDVNFTLSDNLSGIVSKACTSPTIGTCTISDSNRISITTDGNHAITYTATDNAGNTSSPAIIYAALDKSAPAISNKSPTNDTNIATPTLSFDLNDSGSGIKSSSIVLTINSVNAVFTKTAETANGVHVSYTFATIANDINTSIVVDANDNAGNKLTDSWSFKVDTTAPSVSGLSINSGATYTKTASLTLNFTGSGNCAFRNESSAYSSFEAYSSSKSWTLSSGDGTKTVTAVCKDFAGNYSAEVSDTIALDTNAPSIAFGSPLNNSTVNSTTVSLSCTGIDINGGISKYYTRLDTGAWADLASDCSRNYTSVTNGLHTITVIATDNADNNSSEYSTSFTVSTSSVPDTTPDNSSDATNPKV
ncbi:MAG: hypothetical protein Q7K43_03695, partial [Candidatus Woesearchaeota archaeon]|nr:hypothetical protein [Candidatus Woesearchaeota archaeon]